MTLLEAFTSKAVTMTGGLLAAGAAVIAQSTSTDTTVGTGSFLLGSAGLVAAISAFTKDYWSDRQKQREHDVVVLRIKSRSSGSNRALAELYNWAKDAHAAVPALPAVPALRLEADRETDAEPVTDTEREQNHA